MSLADACDVAHFLLAERIVGNVRSAQQSAMVCAVLGADVDVPDIGEALAELADRLTAQPDVVTGRVAVLRRALGVGDG